MKGNQTSGMQSGNVSLLSEAESRVTSGRAYHCGGVYVCVFSTEREREKSGQELEGNSQVITSCLWLP